MFTQGTDRTPSTPFRRSCSIRRFSFPVLQHSPKAALDDGGVGVYGQGTITLHNNLDVALGARIDHESKSATLDTFFDPALGPPAHVDADRSFSDVSPQVSAAYRLEPERMAYVSVGRGYKAGGFNPGFADRH